MRKTTEIIKEIQNQLNQYCDDAALSDYINNALKEIEENEEKRKKDLISRFTNCANMQREMTRGPKGKYAYEDETYEHAAEQYENAINIVNKVFEEE